MSHMLTSKMTIAGITFEQRRRFRSRKCVWVTPDESISIHDHIVYDKFTVFVNGELLPRDYKTLAGAVRAAIKVKEQP